MPAARDRPLPRLAPESRQRLVCHVPPFGSVGSGPAHRRSGATGHEHMAQVLMRVGSTRTCGRRCCARRSRPATWTTGISCTRSCARSSIRRPSATFCSAHSRARVTSGCSTCAQHNVSAHSLTHCRLMLRFRPALGSTEHSCRPACAQAGEPECGRRGPVGARARAHRTAAQPGRRPSGGAALPVPEPAAHAAQVRALTRYSLSKQLRARRSAHRRRVHRRAAGSLYSRRAGRNEGSGMRSGPCIPEAHVPYTYCTVVPAYLANALSTSMMCRDFQ